MQSITASEALQEIKSNQNVFIHSAAAAPQHLVKHLVERAPEVKNVQIYHLHTEGIAPYAEPEYADNFRVNALFIGSNVRKAIQDGRGSYIPIFLSEAPRLFRSGVVPIDVALITVSPPDKHGFCSLGVSVDITRAVVDSAKIVIAQVNKYMPRAHGDGQLHISHITHMVEHDEPLPEVTPPPAGEVELKIGRYIAELVEDEATLQMGIGAIPNAVLSCLGNHKNLGVHTEMFSDGMLPLVESGVINCTKKRRQIGQIVSSFAVGSQKLYDFIDDNPMIEMLGSDEVNNVDNIRRNDKVTAINSAIEIDLTGQVCADSIGQHIYSGVGGQMDFIRGASLSEGGKPIIAVPSISKSGVSKIVPNLKLGAGVVTTRAHVHYVVTEYGVVNLHGKSMRERAKLLISIAAPQVREELERQACELHLCDKL